MKTVAVLLALFGSAVAFAPASQSQASTSLGAALDDMTGSTMPVKAFDPLGLADFGSDETLAWFRAAELKHGRCAMVAATGFIVQAGGMHFPGMLSHDISFESLSTMKPIDQWAAVPDAGKAQILFTIFCAELITEGYQGTHYMKGGELPTMVFPPIDFSGVSEQTMTLKRNRELNNGRLAMIATMGFIAEASVPGSVPVLTTIGAF
ncbi:chloroplastic [Seminavis robusta]|uniref:Chloroplastic n=1 Tax=Seminavis robusta TaxID=568900 RepID=A0A9N8DNZ7_9STRA|nr:chloroplastic [Seminavis robusta]|eukprot:Sro236_g095070.1 chloroplastic (207) ;mRNA; r:66696-67502